MWVIVSIIVILYFSIPFLILLNIDHFIRIRVKKDIKSYQMIVGLQTEYCVDTTCRRAFSLGFRTTLIKDAHSTCDSSNLKAAEIIKHHNQVLSDWFVELKTADQINF